MLYSIVFEFCLFWIVCSGILKLYETETETETLLNKKLKLITPILLEEICLKHVEGQTCFSM